MKFLASLLALVLSVTFMPSAHADDGDLFAPVCAVESADAGATATGIVQFAPLGGTLTCDQLKSLQNGINVTAMEIFKLGAGAATSSALGIGTAALTTLQAQIAALGLTNPAVLAVTLGGGALFYVVLNTSVDLCAQMDQQKLQEKITIELDKNYGVQNNGNIKIQITK